MLGGALSRLMARPDVTKPWAEKSSGPVPLFAVETTGHAVWTPRDYSAFAREGVMQNAIVYRCVRMIAEASASVPLCLYEGDAELTRHPLLDLLNRPSPGQTGTDMLEAWYGFLMVSGNTYLEAVALDGRLRELHVLRPDRLQVIPGPNGWPEAWDYIVGGQTVRIDGEAVPGVAPVLQIKLFHPANDHYGLSPIEAAATAIDLHNAASRWNKALLDNSARPSGALVYSSGGNLSGDQFERLKAELEASFQGARNAGRPLLLEGGLDWKSMSMSPRDMDFLEAKHTAAREIALAIGVPPMLLGIPGDNTYSNMAEANRAFWRQTVLPLVARTARALGGWLAPAFGGDLRLVPDTDEIPALSGERDALWARLQATTFLTDDEKRAAVGYEAKGVGGGSTDGSGNPLAKFNPHHDDRGRFTFGPGDAPIPVAKKPTPVPPSLPKGPFKTPKPGQSGKEGATDIPSWARGQRPLVGENGDAFAKRVLDAQYGAGQYDKGPNSEFSKIKKFGERSFD